MLLYIFKLLTYTSQQVDISSAHDQMNADAVDVSPSAEKGSSQDKKKKKDKPKNDITCKFSLPTPSFFPLCKFHIHSH